MTPTEVNAWLAIVNVAIPEFGAAYSLLKLIWTRTNPGKDEAAYLAYLKTSSQANIDDSAAILVADGYVLQADGSWKKG